MERDSDGTWVKAGTAVVAVIWLGLIVQALVWTVHGVTWQGSHLMGQGQDRISLMTEALLRSSLNPWPVLFDGQSGAWADAPWLGAATVVYAVSSILWRSGTYWHRFVPACALLPVAGGVVWEATWSTIPGVLVAYRCGMLLGVTIVGLTGAWLLSRASFPLWSSGGQNSGEAPRKRSSGGFTLVEVLTAVTIILVLAAISMAVYARAKKGAIVSREIAQMRQVFIAINLYESDYDGQSPKTLLDLDPVYLNSKYLTCPSDERRNLHLNSFPANPWINDKSLDPPDLLSARTKSINSYFYLRTFVGRADNGRLYDGRTFDELRSESSAGLLAGVGLLQCGECQDARYCSGSCEYWTRAGEPETVGHPAVNLGGDFVVVRMDGSTYVRHRDSDCAAGEIGYSALFFGASLNCKKRLAVP